LVNSPQAAFFEDFPAATTLAYVEGSLAPPTRGRLRLFAFSHLPITFSWWKFSTSPSSKQSFVGFLGLLRPYRVFGTVLPFFQWTVARCFIFLYFIC